MLKEFEDIVGKRLLRAFIFVVGCLYVWHTFFGSVAEVGTTKNVIEQGNQAAVREPAVTEKAVADAGISKATQKYIDEKAKAEAESVEAQAKLNEEAARYAVEQKKAEAEKAISDACLLYTSPSPRD